MAIDPNKIEFKQYATYKHYTRGMEAAKRYRGWVERKTTRRAGGRRGGRFTRFGRGVAMAPAGLIEYGSVIPPAFEKLAREPRTQARAMIPGLIRSAKTTYGEFRKRPYELGGEIVGQAALAYGAKKLSPIKFAEVKVPTGKLVTPKTWYGAPKGKPVPQVQTYRGIYAKIPFSRDVKGVKPVVGAVGAKPVIGAPKFKIPSGYVPETMAEFAVTKPSITRGLKPPYAAKFQRIITTAGKLRRAKVKPQIPLRDVRVKYVPKTAMKGIEQYIRQKKGVVYGSVSQKMHLGKRIRMPADIDIQFKKPEIAAKNILKIIKESSPDAEVRLSPTNPTLIETKVGGQWHHAIDIHKMHPTGVEYGFGFKTMRPTKYQGVRIMPMAEQYQRKVSSIIVPRDGKIAPAPWRAKDIVDYQRLTKALLESEIKNVKTKSLKPPKSHITAKTPQIKPPQTKPPQTKPPQIKLPQATKQIEMSSDVAKYVTYPDLKYPSYKIPTYKPLAYKPLAYKPLAYKPPVYKPQTYKPLAYKTPIYKIPTYKPPSYKPLSYKPLSYKPLGYKPPGYKIPTYKPPSYKPPSYKPPSYKIPTHKPPTYKPPRKTPKKKKHKKKKHEEELKKYDELERKYDPSAWLEKHPIPTLAQMLGGGKR